ncbi:hypothetical protein O181_109033 [Austropuccinia psidii MF-1]|uniref:Uncharacterized protein n=1 Tax=Austropuccinia psidii MF-1 TaxID=1389203 RepID=A0A9Q3JTY8_9BASI|nr:hypothetical protein [Austropuccinia psidii MF-1]
MEIHPPSIPYLTLRTIQDIKNLLLQLSLKKKRNGKSQILDSKLKRQSYGIWCNGMFSVKNQKDPLGNQVKTSGNFENLSRILILYILKIQNPIPQDLDYLWCLVGRGTTKGRSHCWYEYLEVF